MGTTQTKVKYSAAFTKNMEKHSKFFGVDFTPDMERQYAAITNLCNLLKENWHPSWKAKNTKTSEVISKLEICLKKAWFCGDAYYTTNIIINLFSKLKPKELEYPDFDFDYLPFHLKKKTKITASDNFEVIKQLNPGFEPDLRFISELFDREWGFGNCDIYSVVVAEIKIVIGRDLDAQEISNCLTLLEIFTMLFWYADTNSSDGLIYADLTDRQRDYDYTASATYQTINLVCHYLLLRPDEFVKFIGQYVQIFC